MRSLLAVHRGQPPRQEGPLGGGVHHVRRGFLHQRVETEEGYQ
jgi:hypothetical protein